MQDLEWNGSPQTDSEQVVLKIASSDAGMLTPDGVSGQGITDGVDGRANTGTNTSPPSASMTIMSRC